MVSLSSRSAVQSCMPPACTQSPILMKIGCALAATLRVEADPEASDALCHSAIRLPSGAHVRQVLMPVVTAQPHRSCPQHICQRRLAAGRKLAQLASAVPWHKHMVSARACANLFTPHLQRTAGRARTSSGTPLNAPSWSSSLPRCGTDAPRLAVRPPMCDIPMHRRLRVHKQSSVTPYESRSNGTRLEVTGSITGTPTTHP